MDFSDDLFNGHIKKLRKPWRLPNKNGALFLMHCYTFGKTVYAIRKA